MFVYPIHLYGILVINTQSHLGHEQMLIFNIQMFECLLTPTQWVFNSLINLCSDNL